jgi:hypothetical protein
MPDADLLAALKQAKMKKMFFAFVPKGTDGKLLISKKKIPPKVIQEAKKEIGGGMPVTGKCFGEEGTMVFLVAKPAPPALTAAVKKVARRDSGLTIDPEFRVAHDADAEEPETTSPTEAGAAAAESAVPAPAPAPTAPPPPPTTATAQPAATAPQRPPTEQELVVLEDRRREFKKARSAWVAVKTKAEEDLEKVKDGARMAYVADASQFPKVAKGCKDIDDILDNLDDNLRDTLDKYASTPLKDQAKLHTLAATATEILDRYVKYVESNPIMKAIDSKEFADVTVHAPIMKALGDLRKALA